MKLATLNLHNMSEFSEKIKEVSKIIRSKNIDTICFQEIPKKTAVVFSRYLGMNHIYFGGLAILSAYQFRDSKFIKLKRNRTAISVEISNNFSKYRLLVTHLDHEFEECRMEELEILEKDLKETDFLIGDLNSLHLNDYSKAKLNEINRSRSISNWQGSRSDVLNYIKKFGFVVGLYSDYTCRFYTRIDYILHRSNFKTHQEVLDCMENKITDHNMVVAEMI